MDGKEDPKDKIHEAIKADQHKQLALLLGETKELQTMISHSRCPLHLAVNYGSYRCLELLLNAGKAKRKYCLFPIS